VRWVVIAITLVSVTASADPERAKQLSAEADALVANGDLIGAAAKFRAAYAEEPRPEHICNSGVAYHKAKDLPRSHRYLNQCVSMGGSLEPAYRENLKKVVDSIEQKLVGGEFTPIDISLAPSTAVLVLEGGKPFDEELIGGGRIWVPYGVYRFVVRAPGFVEKSSNVTAIGHAAMPLRVTLEPAPIEKPKPIEAPIVEPAVVGPSKVPAIAVSITAGALAVTSLYFYMRARGYVSDAESDEITVDEYRDLHDKAHSNQRIAWVVGGLAGAAAVASGILWWRVLRAPAQVEVTTSGTGVAIRGRF
jgi:hypothetical protein